MLENEIDPNSIEDFELKQPTYQVWLFRYNELDDITGDEFIQEFSKFESAKARADELAEDETELNSYFNDSTAYVGIEVEEVVLLDNGWEENQGSLYIVNKINPNFDHSKIL